MGGNRKKYEESSDSSSSSSSSESENERRRRHRHHKKEKECKKEVECYDNKHHKHDSESEHSSSDECKPRFKLCDIYNYFRNRLVEDKDLMIAGSDAYGNAVNQDTQMVPTTHGIEIDKCIIKYNVDKYNHYSPFFVREDGIYVIFFMFNTDSACQFTLFVNGVVHPFTCVGTNAGAGQLVSRHILPLKKNDNVAVRNYLSTANSVTSNVYSGGTVKGNDITFLLLKIAPYEHLCVNYEKEECFLESLSHKKKHLFKRLTEKLLCDNELMPLGFNVNGSFYNRSTQTINLESNVVFNEMGHVNGLLWDATNPDQIKITEDGIYKLFFLLNTTTGAQFSVSVNGIPNEDTTQGTSRGASQFTLRTLLELKKNDIVTITNHSSATATGAVVASEYAGGTQQTVSACLLVFKIANLTRPLLLPVDCKVKEHYECLYEKFREYLLYKKYLQIQGSNNYFGLSSSITQEVEVNNSFRWDNKILDAYDGNGKSNHVPGYDYLTIRQDGYYDLLVDIITDQPQQIALFVNGVVVPNAIFGRDSGATRCLLRQTVKLMKNDIITIRNYMSNSGTVNTAENPGGNYIGQSITFMAFLLAPVELPPLCHPCLPLPPPPMPQASKPKKK